MKHHIIIFQPDGKRIGIHAGATLLEAAHQAGIILNTVCGGQGTCGKCAVLIQQGDNEVLACQHVIDSDLTVTIPSTSRFFQQKILERGIKQKIKVHPTVIKQYVQLEPLAAEILVGYLDEQIPKHIHKMSPAAVVKLKQLSTTNPESGVTIVCHHDPDQLDHCGKPDQLKCTYHLFDIESGDTTDKNYGLAVDIGTTTVVAKLIDLTDGKILGTEADFNPQAMYGDDVVSRINFAQTDAQHAELQKTIIECMNYLIKKLHEKTGVDPQNIYELTAVGNTTMSHLFLGFPVKQLGQAPFKAYSLDAQDIPAAELNVNINPAGNIHVVENIAGFLGSDTTAAGLAVSINLAEPMTLLIDIGTNGELIFGNKDKLYSASCAAGPALEGARISQGSRAVAGAIEAVVKNDFDIDVDTIGSKPAVSICGSGLIDAVAVMLDVGVLDSTGRIANPDDLSDDIPEGIHRRLMKKDDAPAFVLAWGEKLDEPAVTITQKDVREFQLAKAALRAGIQLLQMRLELEDDDIEQVLIAGAFGNYIRKESALRVGLLPDIPVERIHFVGNAASSGAQMILLDRKSRAIAGELAESIEYIEIGNDPKFNDAYAEAMIF